VLVVDDDESIRRWLARQLLALGYVADLAGDGAKAIAMASAHSYDVVLTDLLMPGFNGIELMSSLAQRLPCTSFILMTGAPTLADRNSHAVEGRLTTVLAKPLDAAELEAALREAVEVTRRRRESTRPSAIVSVLLLEDSESDALLVQHALRLLGGFETTHVTRLADAVRLLHETTFDTILTDLSLPDARGLGAVIKLRECAHDATLLVRSSVADDALALRVIELGAQDFIVKGAADAEQLGRSIRFARVRRESERGLGRLAHTDPLTGLANRAAFDERLDQALALAKRHGTTLGVMYIDLDGFKAVNDSRGHDAGDAVLQEVGKRMRGCLRDYDIVARLGGDEFGVVVTNLAVQALDLTAKRIASAIVKPVALPGGAAVVSASIGVAEFPDTADEAVLLVKLADEAMYCMKRAGKSGIQWAESTVKPALSLASGIAGP
jgi:diguanylate cyclase (GGDEF)-like protein